MISALALRGKPPVRAKLHSSPSIPFKGLKRFRRRWLCRDLPPQGSRLFSWGTRPSGPGLCTAGQAGAPREGTCHLSGWLSFCSCHFPASSHNPRSPQGVGTGTLVWARELRGEGDKPTDPRSSPDCIPGGSMTLGKALNLGTLSPRLYSRGNRHRGACCGGQRRTFARLPQRAGHGQMLRTRPFLPSAPPHSAHPAAHGGARAGGTTQTRPAAGAEDGLWFTEQEGEVGFPHLSVGTR